MNWTEIALWRLLLYVCLYVLAYQKNKVPGGFLIRGNIDLAIQILICIGFFCVLDLLLYLGGFESIRYLLQVFERLFWRRS